MRKKGTFIGLTKKEDQAYIRCLCEALYSPRFEHLTENQQQVITGSLKFLIYDNLEFIHKTFYALNSILDSLLIQRPTLKVGKDGYESSGSWYIIPRKEPEERAKKLRKRQIFRRRAFEAAYFELTGKTWEWDTIEDRKRGDERLKEIGRPFSQEIIEDRHPESAVIVPFKRD